MQKYYVDELQDVGLIENQCKVGQISIIFIFQNNNFTNILFAG